MRLKLTSTLGASSAFILDRRGAGATNTLRLCPALNYEHGVLRRLGLTNYFYDRFNRQLFSFLIKQLIVGR